MLKVILDINKCHSVKNKKNGLYIQCKNKKKINNLCLKHNRAKNIIYFKDSINEKNKEKAIKIIDKLKKKIREKYLKKLSGPCYENICKADNMIDVISREVLWGKSNN